MKLEQNFVKYFVHFLGIGVSRKNVFEIYWPLRTQIGGLRILWSFFGVFFLECFLSVFLLMLLFLAGFFGVFRVILVYILLVYIQNTLGILWEYFWKNLGILLEYLGNTLDVPWEIFGNILGIHWEYSGNSLGILWEYIVNTLEIRQNNTWYFQTYELDSKLPLQFKIELHKNHANTHNENWWRLSCASWEFTLCFVINCLID